MESKILLTRLKNRHFVFNRQSGCKTADLISSRRFLRSIMLYMGLNKYGYTRDEIKVFLKLKTPQKIQDYLNSLKFNFEKNEETCMSPRFVINGGKAHCMEGAMFAAAVLEFHGSKPLLLDLRSDKELKDYDHVVAVFKKEGCFGAISKTNHAILRYREPIYKTVRELALSYFHEYFTDKGKKNRLAYNHTTHNPAE